MSLLFNSVRQYRVNYRTRSGEAKSESAFESPSAAYDRASEISRQEDVRTNSVHVEFTGVRS